MRVEVWPLFGDGEVELAALAPPAKGVAERLRDRLEYAPCLVSVILRETREFQQLLSWPVARHCLAARVVTSDGYDAHPIRCAVERHSGSGLARAGDGSPARSDQLAHEHGEVPAILTLRLSVGDCAQNSDIEIPARLFLDLLPREGVL